MAEIINLNRFRKDKARQEKEAKAAANRITHGRTKREKEEARQRNERETMTLDGKKLDD